MESLVRPFGAFLEYTVLPILDRTRELIELADKRGLDLRSSLTTVIFLFVIDKIVGLATTLAVTYLVCYTALLISQTLN